MLLCSYFCCCCCCCGCRCCYDCNSCCGLDAGVEYSLRLWFLGLKWFFFWRRGAHCRLNVVLHWCSPTPTVFCIVIFLSAWCDIAACVPLVCQLWCYPAVLWLCSSKVLQCCWNEVTYLTHQLCAFRLVVQLFMKWRLWERAYSNYILS